MFSTDSYTNTEAKQLLDLARQAIDYGLVHQEHLPVNRKEYPDHLYEPRATFVTLHRFEQLRGCCGTLIATRPLVEDVVASAYAAAFLDSRFPPLSQPELDGLQIAVSVLSPLERLEFTSETDLLAQIRVGVDGLLLEEGLHCGTFLPVMWEQLPKPQDFWCHLKRKAGLSFDYWSNTLRVSRYTATYLK